MMPCTQTFPIDSSRNTRFRCTDASASVQGEVYKARDTRLDRTVAIKVLLEHLAKSPERKARFEREAKAISQLNHPHICTLHDVGEQDGIDYLVMEYIEGETLAERLRKGALPLDKALEYGIQIADGLDVAHRAGIVHRDLKPGNAMLTKSGIKLLDFGLAKVLAEESDLESSDAPTRQKDLTKENTIIGTLQYMAPEQLEGETADARADIFAFGAVLYEMITGRKAFEGDSRAVLMGAILKDEVPPLSAASPMSPTSLDHAIKMCLDKDRERRWQSAGDMARELEWIAVSDSRSGASAPIASRPRAVLLTVAGLVGALVGGLAIYSLRGTASHRNVSTIIETNGSYAGPYVDIFGEAMDLAISPDGASIAYSTSIDGGGRQLYIRSLDKFESRPLLSIPANPRQPFFSADSSWVGFLDVRGGRSGTALMKVPVVGGPATEICRTPQPVVMGASWRPGDTIVFGDGGGRGLWRVAAKGGEPERIIGPDEAKGEFAYRWPTVLPDGRSVLFVSFSRSISGVKKAIVLLSLDTGQRTTLIENGTTPRYVHSGYLVYGADSTLLAVSFDIKRLRIAGTSVPVVNEVVSTLQGATYFDVSKDGTLVYTPGRTQRFSGALVWVNRDGQEQLIERVNTANHVVQLSPDGTRIVLDDSYGAIWVYDLIRNTRLLVVQRSGVTKPRWTPSGEVMFNQGGDVYVKGEDGSTSARKLIEEYNAQGWSPDGRLLAVEREGNIWIIPKDGEPQPFADTPADERAAEFSPDGQFIAYISNESGRNEVYVRPYPGPGAKVLVSTHGGTAPVWSSTGRELFYRQGTAVMAVEIRLQPSFAVGTPTSLFDGPYLLDGSGHPAYDVSNDGKRFLMIKRVELNALTEYTTRIRLVQNFQQHLQQLVP